MDTAPRLKNGAIIPTTAIRCLNRFAPPDQQRWSVETPWLPVDLADLLTFDSREAALAAILEHDRSQP